MATSAQPGDVAGFIDGIQNDARREDCRELMGLMRAVIGEEPKLWGTSMVGFGTYHYRYASGREGDSFKVGFAPRTSNLTIYLMSGMVGYDDLLRKLGPHKTGKSCLYVKVSSPIAAARTAMATPSASTSPNRVRPRRSTPTL